jgi:hypothetical protein
VFTVRFLVFGEGAYVAAPEAIRDLFTGITLAPRHGAPVPVVSKRAAPPEASRKPAAATGAA